MFRKITNKLNKPELAKKSDAGTRQAGKSCPDWSRGETWNIGRVWEKHKQYVRKTY